MGCVTRGGANLAPTRALAEGGTASRHRFARPSVKVLSVMLLALAAALLLACDPGDDGESSATTAAAAGSTSPTSSGEPGSSPETRGTSADRDSSATTEAPPASGADQGVVTETERLSPKEGSFAICQDCHAFLDLPGQMPETLTQSFSHTAHINRGAECESCHELPVHAASGTRRPTMARCFTCHGDDPSSSAPGDCDYCHPPGFPTMPSSHTQAFFEGGHARVAERTGSEDCLLCHRGTAETFCRDCHGIELPHPENWTRTPAGDPGIHVAESYQQGEKCARCHDNRVEPPGSCYGGECHGS